ncbi:MAG: response regulator [Rhodoferax sp.]|nr:response regulator [Rhodoferax sp.]
MKILHLEDSVLDHQLVCRALRKDSVSIEVDRVESIEEFTRLTREASYDIILADYRLPGFTALDAWAALPTDRPSPPFILLSGTIGESAAVAAIHLGISDYLHKDELHRLDRVIRRALEVRQAVHAKEQADAELAASERRLAGFAEHLQSAIEQERASIAREIHDDIGGSLAAAKLDLAWLSRHATDTAVQNHIQAATDMLQHAIGASQRIMMNLRPSILDQGLFAAVQWLATGFERRTGISTRLNTNHESLSLGKPIELTAYRTAQEALTNISKYACCSKVQIELSDAEGVLTLEISDNGKGISTVEMQKPSAYGLKGLQERAKTVGGWLDISTREGHGTSIILSVPLTPAGHFVEEEHDQ